KISGDFSVVSTISESNFNDDNNNNNDETKVELKDDGTSTPVPAESVVVKNTKPAQQEEPQENISTADNTKNEVEVEHADEKDANIVAEAVAAAVLANGMNELKDSGKEVPQEKTEVIHQPEGDSKTKKLLNSIVGDENDPYRSLKIAVLVAGVVSVSGGIAYYFFVRVK
ncbi:unnamed protein product, partial [Anisakis simplex]|uniref:Serine protease n=1 Tax=Anisakis simplex TaxID=6269 RepID=A0A0M3JEG0_ANISI